jgi:lysophospholipase L1-like esterase
MKILAFSLLGFVAVYLLYGLLLIFLAIHRAKPLVAQARPYTRGSSPSHSRTLLVLGDSTAVGVGATPETSVPGRLAEHLNASVENYAVSGARTKDLAAQRARAPLPHYDYILVQIGANDVTSFSTLTSARDTLNTELTELSKLSSHIFVLTAGDIGATPVFITPFRWLVSYRTRVLRDYFKATCAQHGATYIDIYAEPNLIATDVATYHAPDLFHLSPAGYEYWFTIVKKYL